MFLNLTHLPGVHVIGGIYAKFESNRLDLRLITLRGNVNKRFRTDHDTA